MKRWVKVLIILSCVLLLFLIFIVVSLYKLITIVPTIKYNSTLILPIKGELIEEVPIDWKGSILYRDTPTIMEILNTIDKAKLDKRINSIIVKIGPLKEVGWAKVDEIRNKLIEFKNSGKVLVTFLEEGYTTDKEYYLATASDKIYAPEGAFLEINGLLAEVIFLRGTLDKLEIVPNIEQVGKYKVSAEIFTRKTISEAHKEVINSILDERFEQLINAIATARNKSSNEVKKIINNGPFTATQALKYGLIDKLLYIEQLEELVKKESTGVFNKVSFKKYKEIKPQVLGLQTGKRIALIYATGSITFGKSRTDPLIGKTMGSETISEAIKDAASDKKIKAIILRIDSPGGSGSASDIIWQSINLAKKKKPVVVSMSDIAASGGYYIAMNADKIVAQPSTITGSIGVFGGKLNLAGFYEKLGINKEIIKRGKYADMFSDIRDFTEEEKEKFKEYLLDFYMNEFVKKVAAGRRMKKEQVHRIAQGRIWTGNQAKKIGLVDELGGLDKAIEIAKEMANIPKEVSCKIVIYPQPKKLLSKLIEEFMSIFANNLFNITLEEEVKSALKLYHQTKIFDDKILLIMPYNLRIE